MKLNKLFKVATRFTHHGWINKDSRRSLQEEKLPLSNLMRCLCCFVGFYFVLFFFLRRDFVFKSTKACWFKKIMAVYSMPGHII